MTDLDLERLGDVWRQRPDQAEMDALQRAAAAASRRARYSWIFNLTMGAAAVGAVIFLALANPRAEVVTIAGGAVLLLIYTSIRQRRLRQVELQGFAGSTEVMLSQLIERTEARLKYNRFLARVAAPMALAIFLFRTISRAPRTTSIPSALTEALAHPLVLGAIIPGVAAAILVLLIAIRRDRRKLERLQAMAEIYQREDDPSRS